MGIVSLKRIMLSNLFFKIYICFNHTRLFLLSDYHLIGDRETFLIVYVEWASRVNFMTIFGDLYQNKLWVICNNLNQFAHLSSASGPSNDVIKMAAIVLLMYIYKKSY